MTNMRQAKHCTKHILEPFITATKTLGMTNYVTQLQKYKTINVMQKIHKIKHSTNRPLIEKYNYCVIKQSIKDKDFLPGPNARQSRFR